jgi:tetratricopeptide (TPR) repeat protein
MNRFLITLLLLALNASVQAQQDDPNSLQATAKNYTRDGDFSNAIVVLNRAIKISPNNLELQKDLAFNFYLQKNYSQSLETSKPLLERKDADEQCYQLVGLVYKAIEERKECEKCINRALSASRIVVYCITSMVKCCGQNKTTRQLNFGKRALRWTPIILRIITMPANSITSRLTKFGV